MPADDRAAILPLVASPRVRSGRGGAALDLGAGISSELRTATGLEGSFFADGVGRPLLMIGLLSVVTLFLAAIVLDRRVTVAVYDEYDEIPTTRHDTTN